MSSATYWYAVGCIEMAKGNPDSSITCFTKTLEGWTDYPTHFMLARAYLEAGRLADDFHGAHLLVSPGCPPGAPPPNRFNFQFHFFPCTGIVDLSHHPLGLSVHDPVLFGRVASVAAVPP